MQYIQYGSCKCKTCFTRARIEDPDRKPYDVGLRFKAQQMASGSPNSVEHFLKKLRAEEK